MRIVETYEYKSGVVTLVENEKSNVIGKGGWSVRVSAPHVTKQLNFSTEYQARIRFHEEGFNLIFDS